MTPKTIWSAVLCGLAGFALSAPVAAKDLTTGTQVEFRTTINDLRVVPEGPMAGLHVDAKVNGRILDIYIAPMPFLEKNGVKLEKGRALLVVGTQDGDVVIPRSVTTGTIGRADNVFRPDMTLYLRNDDGPLWMP